MSRNNFDTPTDAWDESRARISAVNPSSRSLITMDSGVQWERLAATSDNAINFMEIVYELGAQSNESGDLVLTLSKGHSIGFDSSIPHKFRNIGTVDFHGIWFVHGCAGVKK